LKEREKGKDYSTKESFINERTQSIENKDRTSVKDNNN